MIALQTSKTNIYVYNDSQKKTTMKKQKLKTYDIEEYQLEYKGIKKICGFSFLQTQYFNFFVLSDQELELLKFDPFSQNVIHVKKIMIQNVSQCVYEMRFFNVLCAVQNDGSLLMCDLNVNPKTKTVKYKIGVLGKSENEEVHNSTY